MTADGLAQLRQMAEQACDKADNPAPLVALVRLEAAEAQRDTLAEALREIAAYEDECIHQRQARAALAEAGLE